jgi:phage-related protein
MKKGLKEYGKVVTNFFKEIGSAGEARLLRDLRDLAEYRQQVNEKRNISKSLGHRLFEIKTKHAKQHLEYRCIYAFLSEEIVILVCFIKKKQKTDPSLIAQARSRLEELKQKKQSTGDVTLH